MIALVNTVRSWEGRNIDRSLDRQELYSNYTFMPLWWRAPPQNVVKVRIQIDGFTSLKNGYDVQKDNNPQFWIDTLQL